MKRTHRFTPTTDTPSVSISPRGADILSLSRLIAEVQTALRRRAAAKAALWMLAAALVVAAAVLMADVACGLAGVRAAVYLATTAAGLAAVAGAAFLAARPVPSPLFVALLVEERRPDLKNSLITFAELASESDPDLSACGAVARRAARLLAGMPPAEFLPAPAFRRPLTAVATTTTLLVACLWLAQGAVFAPWAAAAQAEPATVADGNSADLDGQGSSPSGAELSPPREQRDTGDQPCTSAQVSRRFLGGLTLNTYGRGEGSALSSAGPGSAVTPGPTGPIVPGDSNLLDPAGGPGSGTNPATTGRPDGREASHPGSAATTPRNLSNGNAAAPGAAGRDGPGGGGASRAGLRQPYDGPPPLVQRPQSEEFPQDVLGSMRTTRPAANQARPHGEEKTDAFLGKMGAGGPTDSQRYSAAWPRGPETAVRGAETASPRCLGPVPAVGGELIPAGLGQESRPYADKGGPPDGRRDLVQGDDAPVSARLRPAVAAYFDAVSRLAAPRTGG
jgi:hypothetical protein